MQQQPATHPARPIDDFLLCRGELHIAFNGDDRDHLTSTTRSSFFWRLLADFPSSLFPSFDPPDSLFHTQLQPTMLKLVKRTAQAEKQVARRRKIRERALDAIHDSRVNNVRKSLNEEIRLQEKQARRARREAWTMGPLAPQRNHAAAMADEARRGRSSFTNRFGNEQFAEESLPHWGTLSIRRLRNEGSSPISEREAKARCAWAGSPDFLCLAQGDRAVVTEGPFKGSIGPIKEIRVEQGTVTLEGVGRVSRDTRWKRSRGSNRYVI